VTFVTPITGIQVVDQCSNEVANNFGPKQIRPTIAAKQRTTLTADLKKNGLFKFLPTSLI
jgi:hypothetical protein